MKGGKAVESGSYSNNHFDRVIRRRGIYSRRGDADYIRVREQQSSERKKEQFSGFWARLCFGAQYIQSSRLSKSKTESNFKKERIKQWETV